MTLTTYNVATGNDDYDIWQVGGISYTGNVITASVNNAIFPADSATAYANITTSGIPDTDVISAATLKFNENYYFASKGVTKTYRIWIYNGSGWSLAQTNTFSSSGTVRSVILTSTEIGYISKTGYTRFRFSTDDPGAGKARQVDINAYETSQATACRLEVTHAAPVTATFTPKLMIY